MLRANEQLSFSLSQYDSLFNILIDEDNIFRQLKEHIDFSFVYDELKDKYSSTMGRKAVDVIRMFKFLILKNYYKLSDRDLITRTKTDMEFKYFLDYSPEEVEFIDPSLLTHFRREKLNCKENNDSTASNLLDKLISKTVELALEQGVIKIKNKIIQDSTHTNAMFQHISPREQLIKQAKELRKELYKLDETMHDKMPKKREASGLLEDQISYTKELIEIIKEDARFIQIPSISMKMNMLEETMQDTEYELEYSKDADAKVGHKTADTSFFGYKTHIGMTPERIITAVTVTTGEKHDGKELKKLVEKSEQNGIKVEAVIGDGAYSEKENIEYCKERNIKLASKLSKFVTHGNDKRTQGFEYNKDAGMYVCKAGHMAIKKAKQGTEKGNNSKVETYYFDVEKCKHCKYKEGCYKEGCKTKTYSVTIKNNVHIEHMDYMKTEEFQELYKERYKIEAKNAEIKQCYGYANANSCGINGMKIQGAIALFLSNFKRIVKLKGGKLD